jgi:hypothetical protein
MYLYAGGVVMDKKMEVRNVAEKCRVNLHEAERKLIELIRTLKDGEINCIKIQNGLPVFYVMSLEDRRLM